MSRVKGPHHPHLTVLIRLTMATVHESLSIRPLTRVPNITNGKYKGRQDQ